MNKNRLEFLSDGVFAIVMTLITIEIGFAADFHATTDAELWHALREILPLFVAYFVSFNVLAMFWISHNFFFHSLTKNINRGLVIINFIYLSFIALIPFFTKLVGEYSTSQLAVQLYGLDVLAIGIMTSVAYAYARYSDEIETHDLGSRIQKQGFIRRAITPFFTILGIVAAFYNIPLALFFYAFPVVFNTVPGTLNALERLFGFELK